MLCAQCGNRLTDEARFCGRCGAPTLPPTEQATVEVPLATEAASSPRERDGPGVSGPPVPPASPLTCTACAMGLDGTARFCGNCGSPIEAPAEGAPLLPETIRAPQASAANTTDGPPSLESDRNDPAATAPSEAKPGQPPDPLLDPDPVVGTPQASEPIAAQAAAGPTPAVQGLVGGAGDQPLTAGDRARLAPPPLPPPPRPANICVTPDPDSAAEHNVQRTITLQPGQLIAGLPLELWAVIALFAAPGLYFVIQSLRVLPDTVNLLTSGWLGFRLGLIVLFLVLVIAALGVGLLAIARLLHHADRVGRGLAYIAAAAVAAGVLFGSSNQSTGAVLAMLGALGAIAVLALAPAVRAHFTGPNAPQHAEPTSVVIARVCLVCVLIGFALVGFAYFLLGTIEGKYLLVGLGLLALAFAGQRVSGRLLLADRQARSLITVGCLAAFVLLLIGLHDAGAFTLLALVIAVPICLWIPADARAFFGDAPLDLSSVSAQTGQATAPSITPQRPAGPPDTTLVDATGPARKETAPDGAAAIGSSSVAVDSAREEGLAWDGYSGRQA